MLIGEILAIKQRLWRDQIDVVFRYYKNLRFALIDLSLGLFSLFSNPYRTCRKFLQQRKAKDVYAYGETPLTTLQTIVEAIALSKEDLWLELGSGRGKGCFWVACFIGCQVVGVDWVPQFVQIGSILKRLFQIRNLTLIQQDMREVDFSKATAVYLYGTCLEAAQIEQITSKMQVLPKGARVVTISYPLDQPGFTLQKKFAVRYPWGETEAFYQTKD